MRGKGNLSLAQSIGMAMTGKQMLASKGKKKGKKSKKGKKKIKQMDMNVRKSLISDTSIGKD